MLILSSHLHLGLPSGFFPSGLPTKTLYIPLLSPHTRYKPHPSHPFRFYHPKNIGRAIQIIKLRKRYEISAIRPVNFISCPKVTAGDRRVTQMQVRVFWDVTPCRLDRSYRRTRTMPWPAPSGAISQKRVTHLRPIYPEEEGTKSVSHVCNCLGFERAYDGILNSYSKLFAPMYFKISKTYCFDLLLDLNIITVLLPPDTVMRVSSSDWGL